MLGSPCISRISGRTESLKFDYYRATVRADRFDLLEALEDAFPSSAGFADRDSPAIRFFSSGVERIDLEDVRAFALYRSPQSDWPHIIASGFYSPQAAAAIRRFSHAPSRVDVALDLAAPGLFSSLLKWSVSFASRNNIQRSVILNDDAEKGCTIYLGSRTSPNFVRIYQPGLLRAKVEGRSGASIFDLERDAVRVELEHKPAHDRAKVAASSLEPVQFFGLSVWTQRLFAYVSGLDVDRVSVAKPRESDRDRALRHMASQYRNHLISLLAEHHGDLDSFGAAIVSRMRLDRDSG